MQPVRIAVVGLGSWGPRWARILAEESGVELAAIVEPIEERRKAVAAELDLGAAQAFSHLETALEVVAPDALIVVTPPATHLEVAAQAFSRQMPVLMEKPLAATLDEARTIVELAEASDTLMVVSQNYRYRAPMVTLKAALDEGTIGRTLAIKGYCQEDMRLFYEADNFRYLMRHPYVIDMTIHHWDLVRFLTGQEIVRVDARSWRVPDSPYVHDPACEILLDLADGTPVRYEGSGATHKERTSWSAWWEIEGERGRLWTDGGVDDPHVDLVHQHIYGLETEVLPFKPAASLDMVGSLKAFVAAMHGGPLPVHTGRDNLKSLAVVMACVASIERREPVDVAEMTSSFADSSKSG